MDLVIGLILMLIGGTGLGVFWENLPTCDMTKPITVRCREVRGQWGGTVDGRIHERDADDPGVHGRADRQDALP